MAEDQRIPPPLADPLPPAEPTAVACARSLFEREEGDGAGYLVGFAPAETVALIVANVIPVIGVVLLGWRAFPVALWYFLELAIAGLFDLARLIRCEGDELELEQDPDRSPYATTPSRLSAVISFLLVGTAAVAFLGVGVVAVFTGTEADAAASLWAFLSAESIAIWQVPVYIVLLIVAQERAYMRDFIGRELYLRTSMQDVVVDFSGRFAFLFGVLMIVVFLLDRGVPDDRSPLAGVIVLMALKTITDVWRLRRRRHKQLRAAP
jgi:hypothetical protein